MDDHVSSPPSGAPGPSTDSTPTHPRSRLVAIVVGLVIAAGIVVWGRLFPPPSLPPPEAPPPPVAAPAPVFDEPTPPSEFAECRELRDAYDHAGKELNCPHERWGALLKEICEMPFRRKPACIADLRAMVACFKAAPMNVWSCDEDGVPTIQDDACAARDALARCLH